MRFKQVGKVYYFLPGDIDFHEGDHAIVETARGLEYGDVVITDKEVAEKDLVAPLKTVIRRATAKDDKKLEDYKSKEKEALETCQAKIDKHGIDMKLVDVEFTLTVPRSFFTLRQMGTWISATL